MWPNLQETADLVTFTKDIFNGKLHFFVQWHYKWSSWFLTGFYKWNTVLEWVKLLKATFDTTFPLLQDFLFLIQFYVF